MFFFFSLQVKCKYLHTDHLQFVLSLCPNNWASWTITVSGHISVTAVPTVRESSVP